MLKHKRWPMAMIMGGVMGYTVLHPYSMGVTHYLNGPSATNITDTMNMALHAFSLKMLPMGAFFILLGGILGAALGQWWDKHRLLEEKRVEAERRAAIHQTLQELSLTVAHYVRNANAQIGGFGRRMAKSQGMSADNRASLTAILEASDKISAVVDALCSLEDADAYEEVGTTHLRMLDIRSELSRHSS